eukprot:38013-Prorocentrum_minimum.AAC.2
MLSTQLHSSYIARNIARCVTSQVQGQRRDGLPARDHLRGSQRRLRPPHHLHGRRARRLRPVPDRLRGHGRDGVCGHRRLREKPLLRGHGVLRRACGRPRPRGPPRPRAS